MTFPTVEENIRQILMDDGIENVFRGSEKPPSTYIPQTAVFVMQFGGETPESRLSGGKGVQHHVWDVQILVRSGPEDEELSRDTAVQAYDVLRDADLNDDGDGGGWIRVETPPLRLGADQDDIYRWSINIKVHFEA